jgi:predicted aconitase
LTGRTPLYGYHLDENRRPTLRVDLELGLKTPEDFSAMGYLVGQIAKDGVPYFRGISSMATEEFKSLSAALASSGGIAMFQIEGVTPEARGIDTQTESILFTKRDLIETKEKFRSGSIVDFVSVGCPHCTLTEIAAIAEFLNGRRVKKEFWVCCSREMKRRSDEKGYSERIEESGAKFATDTCMVVAPIEEIGYKVVATNSAKACHYLRNGGLGVKFMTLEECVQEALKAN